MNPRLSIAYFVTPHGFGHAARASAVMNAIHDRWRFVHFEIFTRTPAWFFEDALDVSFTYHSEVTDIGLFQTSALNFDLNRTIDSLADFLPFDERHLSRLARTVADAGCLMVISDISPLGIAVAEIAGISSVLIENFTWDWIYEPYQDQDSRFRPYIEVLGQVFEKAVHRIQAAPVCESCTAQLVTPPISRKPVTDAGRIRDQLSIRDQEQMILITMGGVPEALPFLDQMKGVGEDICFVVPGVSGNLPAAGEKHDNVIFLPQNSAFYHPDLVNAADAVVGKVGYSTLAEVFHAGLPYGFVARSNFRESKVFESYIRSEMKGIRISENAFLNGDWLKRLPELLALGRDNKKDENGADAAADYICRQLACEKEILEIVAPDGCVIGAAPRKCVHGNNQLLHRVVHVLVFDQKNRLLLQKRSLKKRVAPGRWDTSVGGHVDCGESVEIAMYREMEEELGIAPGFKPRFAYQYVHSNDFESELVFTFACQYDGEIKFNPDEIDSVKFWDMQEIEDHLGKGMLSDNFEDEFRRYRQWMDT